MPSLLSKAKHILESTYGYSSFRGDQESIISDVLNGDDALVIMPTGGGKSLCYQIPAIVRDGIGVIVSPLIALMQDQVMALKQLGIRAEYLNSTLTAPQAAAVKSKVYRGEIDLLYVAPERLLLDSCIEMLSQTKLSLFAIDEAHCVSQWGHDFRPEYLKLNVLSEFFAGVPRIALTATADPPTRNDIIRHLKLTNAKQYIGSFDRPNITYRIAIKNNAKRQLHQFLSTEHEGDSGIVYCLSRKKVDELTQWLCEEGYNAVSYHAGMSDKERHESQRKFIQEEGVIVVATIAFGMGIDKPNVRFVAHVDLPKSIEAYMQETGRAGRDGLAATAWMTYGFSDISTLRSMIDSSNSPESRRAIEHRKLNALLGFVETTQCRRQVLLNYFGESSEPCNNCDTCISPVESWDGSIEAQQALSCVYRTGQRFGTTYLIDILRGEENERIKRFNHHKLNVFGLGKQHNSIKWSSIFRQLCAAGYLQVDVEGHGGLHLTEASKNVLNGSASVRFKIDQAINQKQKSKTKQKKHEAIATLKNSEHEIFKTLRELRLKIAKEKGIAPYMIFHDKTLMEMAHLKPQSLQQLRKVPGVGDHKLKQFGQRFLSAIKP